MFIIVFWCLLCIIKCNIIGAYTSDSPIKQTDPDLDPFYVSRNSSYSCTQYIYFSDSIMAMSIANDTVTYTVHYGDKLIVNMTGKGIFTKFAAPTGTYTFTYTTESVDPVAVWEFGAAMEAMWWSIVSNVIIWSLVIMMAPCAMLYCLVGMSYGSFCREKYECTHREFEHYVNCWSCILIGRCCKSCCARKYNMIEEIQEETQEKTGVNDTGSVNTETDPLI